MCLGIPGQVIGLVEDNDQLAIVDVAGARRQVNLGLLDPGTVGPEDWVLIHMGFAMEKIDRERASQALAGLETVGRPDDEISGRVSGAPPSPPPSVYREGRP